MEKNLPELFNLGNLLRLWSDRRHILHGRIVSLHLQENICHSYSDNGYLCDFNNVIFNQVILKNHLSLIEWEREVLTCCTHVCGGNTVRPVCLV